MTRKALGTLLGSVLAFALFAAPSTRADDIDQATQLTFNRAVQIPGNTMLPAGTYWFTVLNSTDNHVVQISNEDKTQVVATLPTIDTQRAKATNDAQVTFAEMSDTQPIALVSWFYPDRLIGHEFAYSNQLANRLAEGNKITVDAQPPL